MWTWRKLIIWAVNFCSEEGDKGLTYFYDYFAKEYRAGRRDRLFSSPAAMFRGIEPENVQNCRKVLKNAFAGYREGRNVEVLKKLIGEYREYISGLGDEHAKDRYNAFIYRYMVEAYVGNRAIAAKLGVVRETVLNYINKCIDEMLMFCMGIPAVNLPEEKEAAVHVIIEGSRIFDNMAGDYVLCLFSGKRERATVERGRQLTREIMRQFAEAVKVYSDYCTDEKNYIDTDIRKAGILEKCLAGIPAAALAEEYGCCEGMIYADIKENEKRLAVMLFDEDI